VKTSNGTYVADQVVVAMSSYQKPRVPEFASELRPGVVQLHSHDYKSPSQLQEGPVLLVGAGNSGAEIGIELARKGHETWMAGRDTGGIPFRIDGIWARLFLYRLVLRVIFHRVLTIRTPMGRKARPKMISQGGPLIRVKADTLANAGVTRTGRVVGVRDGLPLLDDGRTLDVANVVWSTGYHPAFGFIELPIFDDHGEPIHEGGVSTEPGLYFVGLHFLYSMSSTMVHGVGRDAERIVETLSRCARRGSASLPATH
jgi:putative flavoprotein involved in K+ transport